MRSFVCRSLACVCLPLLAACTPSVTTPVTPEKPTQIPTTNDVAVEPLDATPVPAPESLAVVVRASSPDASWRAINRLHPIPVDLERGLEKLTDGASRFLDLTGTFDAALGVDPTSIIDDPAITVAVSLPLKGATIDLVEFLRKKGDTVELAGPGRYKIRSGEDLRCELWELPERAPRLVCGDSVDSMKTLAPWLVRTLPTEPKPAEDLIIRASFAVLRQGALPALEKLVEEGLKEAEKELAGDGVSDPELARGVRAAAKHALAFGSDLDTLTFGLKLDRDPSISAELAFRSNTSWFTKVATDGLAETAPPESFLRLPGDVEAAFWGRSADAKHFEDVRRFAKRGASVLLDVAQKESKGLMDATDRAAFEKLLTTWPTSSGTWSVGYGPVKTAPSALPEKGTPTPAQRVAEAKRRFTGALGYVIGGGEGSASELITFLEAAHAAEKRLVRVIEAEADRDLREASPEMRSHYQRRRKEIDEEEPKFTITKDPAGYPKGSALLELGIQFDSDDVWDVGGMDVPVAMTEEAKEDKRAMEAPAADMPAARRAPPPPRKPPPPPPKPVKGTFTIWMAVVPGEGNTFFWAVSADKDALQRKILAARTTGATDTLGGRADLARLKKPMAGGGFVTLGPTLRRFAQIDPEDRDARELVEVLDHLPSKGTAPIFLSVAGTAGDTPRIKWTTTLDGAWVSDLVTVFMLTASDGSRSTPPSMPPQR